MAHRRLDQHPLLAPLVQPDLGLHAYGDALAALHGAQAQLESLIQPWLNDRDFPPRLQDLDADLAALGRQPWPFTGQPLHGGDAAGMIGAMYVIEGAHLGGEVITLRLARSLPATAPRRFFAASGGKARWQRFWDFADSTCPADTHDTTVGAALAAFELFHLHLDNCLAHLTHR